MQALGGLFGAGTDSPITTELAAQLLNALFDYVPNVSDAAVYNLWMDVMAKGALLLDKYV